MLRRIHGTTAVAGLFLALVPALVAAQTLGDPEPPASVPPGPAPLGVPASASPSHPGAQPAPAPAPAPRDVGPFSRTRVRFSFSLGVSLGSYQDYLILGAGVGYYLWDGLEVGLSYEAWLVGDPAYHRLTPELTYTFVQVRTVKPYVGVFYRHTFVADPSPDWDSIGVRGGVAFVPGGPVYVRGGIVFEHALDCDSALYDCDDIYPEIAIGVTL